MLVSKVNYYSRDRNWLFVLVLISPHSWCVLPSGRPLIKPFCCRKLDYPSPPCLLHFLSTAPAIPTGKPFHFTCPSATLNIIPAFSRSDGLSDSHVQTGALYRNCVWLAEARHSGRTGERAPSFCLHSADAEIPVHRLLITKLFKFTSFCLSVSPKPWQNHVVVVDYHLTHYSTCL